MAKKAVLPADSIPLAGIAAGGCSPDGQFVFISLQDQDGKIHSFSLPHEGLVEIILQFSALSEKAAAQRRASGVPADATTGPRVFPLRGFNVGLNQDTGDVDILLKVTDDMQLGFELKEVDAEQMRKGIDKTLKQRRRLMARKSKLN